MVKKCYLGLLKKETFHKQITNKKFSNIVLTKIVEL